MISREVILEIRNDVVWIQVVIVETNMNGMTENVC